MISQSPQTTYGWLFDPEGQGNPRDTNRRSQNGQQKWEKGKSDLSHLLAKSLAFVRHVSFLPRGGLGFERWNWEAQPVNHNNQNEIFHFVQLMQ